MPHPLDPLFNTLRAAASERVWSVGVGLARAGAVLGLKASADELVLSVGGGTRPTPFTVHLWPEEREWSCDCGLEACTHAVAAAIATRQAQAEGQALPQPRTLARLRYAIQSGERGLRVRRELVFPDGRVEPLQAPLRQERRVHAHEGDLTADEVLRLGDQSLPATGWARLLRAWADSGALLTLDAQPVRVDLTPLTPVVVVKDEDRGFVLNLARPKEVERSFPGGVCLAGGALRPWSEGGLNPTQRQSLSRGMKYTQAEGVRLASDILPGLERLVPVRIRTDRLPRVVSIPPRLALDLRPTPSGTLLRLDLVYGDPPVARVVQDRLELLGREVPTRDLAEERRLLAQAEALRLSPGREVELAEDELQRFLRDRLPRFAGELGPQAARYHVRKDPVRLELSADGRQLVSDADPAALLRAWREGSPLVPLREGGYAPLPAELLARHGTLLSDLVAAAGPDGALPRHTLPVAAELLRALDRPPPPELGGLRPLLEGYTGMPELPVPPGLRAELRDYQLLGMRWIRFLWSAGLGGILADDMGLGKTVQALAAVVGQGGQTLVVAPTSVLHNWQREAARFAPGLRVCLYHGPRRTLDEYADLVITSYALLRLDGALGRPWGTVILDEAQAIKNPESRTAQAAFALRAERRLSLTGTPVENRLDELWSQLHFLMPGFLGGRADFEQRLGRPIAEGQVGAVAALRRRVRPFVLRRRKQEVARELPPRTDVVVRCALPEEQRAVYDAVAQAARAEVARLAGGRGALEVLELLLRLRQAACHPGLLPGDREHLPSAKLDALVEQLDEIAAEGHRALVFSQWTSFLDLIEPALRGVGLGFCRLDGSTRDREAVVRRFQSPEGPPVFLLSLKAGGTGLNLTAADYVFHMDPWWNPAVEAQATDRAHRIGQDRPVVSVKLVAADTVEERILELQERKLGLARAALDEETLVAGLSREELLGLLG